MTQREHRQAREREFVETAKWVYETTGSDFGACLEEAALILEVPDEG